MSLLETPTLLGRLVRLEPLRRTNVVELTRAAEEDRSTYGFTSVPQGADAMTAHVDGLLRDCTGGLVVPFAHVDVLGGRAVGMTRFLNMRYRAGDHAPYAVEIGGTWLAGSVQRSGINTEAKLLMLRHAFEVWHVVRVDFKADNRNDRSKTAIARIGATFEGVLRNWQPSQAPGEADLYRDTAMFSVVDAQWPRVAASLASLMR